MTSVFEKYKKTTGVDIQKFFQDFSDFVVNDYNKIIDYFTGSEEPLPKSVVQKLSDLLKEADEIVNNFSRYNEELSKVYDFWELLDKCEEIRIKLQTIENSALWFRSNKTLTSNNELEREYVLSQGQTITSLANDIGYEDPNNAWVDIARSNSIREEDYTTEGGALLKITFKNNFSINITTVLGGVSGEGVYGRDIAKKLTFVQDSTGDWDIKVLTERETILQAYNILLSVARGSIPEFPGDGINKAILGGNVNAIQYPVLFRQLTNLFAQDDTFASFQINKIERRRDALFIEVQATTRIGETFTEKLSIA